MRRLLAWGVIPTRLFLGAIFFTAGMGKIWPDHHFPGLIGPVWLIEQLEKYQLGIFATFIAWSQIIIGLLLMTQRFARIAAIMLVPMLLNILMVTISQNWQGTPYVLTALLLMNIYLIAMDFDMLKWLLSDQKNVTTSGIRTNIRKDLVFLIGVLAILVSPFLAYQQLYLGVFFVVGGLLLITINQYYPRL